MVSTFRSYSASQLGANFIITGQISKTGTRTPPREYNAWWSQETLSVYRLYDKKDICGLASLVLFSQSLKFLYFNVHNQIISTKYTSLLSSRFPFNLLTRMSAKKSPNRACAGFTASTLIKHNSCLIDVCRKGHRLCRSQGDKAAIWL